ncbi:3389_t:CDS:2 [Entrophospora sp. SA101]|nr:3389_t:CDS:2 [Entrophospora sp. SA101]CAJ0823227.1 11983_t:CDS:2 [Entrophospora sp. SA101]
MIAERKHRRPGRPKKTVNEITTNETIINETITNEAISNKPFILAIKKERPQRIRRKPERLLEEVAKTVYDVWNEWNIGLDGNNVSIIDMIEKSGNKWPLENSLELKPRKRIIEYIHHRIERQEVGLDDVLNELEIFRRDPYRGEGVPITKRINGHKKHKISESNNGRRFSIFSTSASSLL